MLIPVLLVAAVAAKERIVVLHAGSLSVPFAKIEKAFEAKHPRYDVVREAAGSRACARKITDLHKKADVMASADYRVIDNLLIPRYARCNIRFATNEMVIAYTPRSRYAEIVDGENWPAILLKKGVRVGHSNPNLDPCGYRTMLVAKLAERHYGKPGFFQTLFGYGDSYERGEERRGKVVVRPKETDLLALLESGAIDYLFIYRSVARQHGLPFVELPDEVNLKSTQLAPLYRQATFRISGKRPGTKIEVTGAPMVYGVTMVEDGRTLPPHPEGARAFLRFLLSPEGLGIIEAEGQGVVDPPVATGECRFLED
jgi:molybdate/tungstate transport system substrate-binding protein